MANADAVERKCALLAEVPPKRTAVVVYDAFRCSSTLLACFASGIVGAYVMEKGVEGSGTSIADAGAAAKALGVDLELGGELDGRPLKGGSVGNSPINAFLSPLTNKILHFQSTNFGRVFVKMLRFLEPNASSDLFVVSYANCVTSARFIQERLYDRIIAACAGFYDCTAIEDMVLGGKFIKTLEVDIDDLDDDALAMIACDRAFGDLHHILARGWTARVLKRMAKFDDVADILDGGRIPASGLNLMTRLVLKAEVRDGLPIIRSIEVRDA